MNVSSVWTRWQRKLAVRSRKTQRTPQVGVEALESRELLSANALFLPSSSELDLDLDSSESVRIRSVGGNVVIEASADGGLTYSMVNSVGTLPAADVLSINILGGDDANTIDLRGVTKSEVDLNGMTVLVNGMPVPAFTNLTSIVVDGANGDDLLFGSSDFGNSLVGGNGKDTIQGGNLGDTLNGGDGADTIFGDVVSTAAGNTPETQVAGGNDVINGGDGEDVIQGIGGNDTIDSGNGDDLVNGGTGNDCVLGANGQDTLIGNGGNDSLNGDGGFDLLYGDSEDPAVMGTGNDTLFGGESNDTVFGGGGEDVMNGQSGDDFVQSVNWIPSVINGVPQLLNGRQVFVSPETQDPIVAPADLPLALDPATVPLPSTSPDGRAIPVKEQFAVLSTGTGDTLPGNPGTDGAVDVVVDAFGAFGLTFRNNADDVNTFRNTVLPTASGAFYDPIGRGAGNPVGNIPGNERSDVAFLSQLFFRQGISGARSPLDLRSVAPGGGPTISVFTSSNGLNELAVSDFNLPGVPDLHVNLSQRVSRTTDGNTAFVGSILFQTYRVTNTGATPQTLDVVRYFDGDLRFDATPANTGINDGGGRTFRQFGTTNLDEILFESDNVTTSAATAQNFVGITATDDGGTLVSTNRFAIGSAGRLASDILAGVDSPTAGINDIVADNPGGSASATGFTATAYDLAIALRNQFVIAPGETVTYTTHTIFGDTNVNDFEVQNVIDYRGPELAPCSWGL